MHSLKAITILMLFEALIVQAQSHRGLIVNHYCFDYLAAKPVTVERYQKVLEEFEKLPLEGKRFDVHRDRFMAVTKGVREIYQR